MIPAASPTIDPGKPKYPRAAAIAGAREICLALTPYCEPGRLIVAGSLRRRKQWVGDVEILYISKLEVIPEVRQSDLLAPLPPIRYKPMADCKINQLAGYMWDEQTHSVCRGPMLITQRKNTQGSITWGAQNKYARHIASNIPIDFFRTEEASWFNYLVCRTGSAESNKRIATAARARGMKWNPYGPGFTDADGNKVAATSEQDVFRLAGLNYQDPWDRI